MASFIIDMIGMLIDIVMTLFDILFKRKAINNVSLLWD